jgi:hypothetical protein
MINTLQLAARKNLIQMSSDVINYISIPEKQSVRKQAWHNS